METIRLLKQHWKIPHPILVCAHTNVAVDNVLEGLRNHGLKPLRYGNIERVPESLHDRAFDTLLQEHPLYPEVQAIALERREVMERLESGEGMTGKGWLCVLTPDAYIEAQQKYSTTLNQKAFLLRRRMFFDVLNDADVVGWSLARLTVDLHDMPVCHVYSARSDRLSVRVPGRGEYGHRAAVYRAVDQGREWS